MLDNLRQSGASLHVLTVVNTTLRSQSNPTTAAALLGENMNLGEVLGDGPKQSGGGREEIVAAAGIVSGLQQLAESLKHQYLIEYTLPDGVKPSDKLSVSVKRKGVTASRPDADPRQVGQRPTSRIPNSQFPRRLSLRARIWPVGSLDQALCASNWP